MKNFYIGVFDLGFYRENSKISFWFDILRVVTSQEEDEDEESGAALFSIEKNEDVWLIDIFFIHII